MISHLEQLAREIAPALRRYHPVKPVPTAYQLKRRQQIARSMQRLRDRRRALGLNNKGQPFKPVNRKYIAKRWINRWR